MIPSLPAVFECRGLGLPEDPVPPVDQRVHVRVDRIGRRHDEDAGAVAVHLVLVQPHRGEPLVPGEPRDVLAFPLGQHVHVAVEIVAGVGMVERRQRAVIERRPEVAREPVGDHDLTVGIGARHQQQDDVVENLAGGGRVVGGQLMDELERHLGRADLSRVDAAGDHHHRFALAEDVVAIAWARRPALEIQPALQLLVAVQVLERVGRADLEQDERVPAVGRAQLAEPDARRLGRRLLHVVDNHVPPRQAIVGADLEPDKLVGRLQLAGRGRPIGHADRGGERAE